MHAKAGRRCIPSKLASDVAGGIRTPCKRHRSWLGGSISILSQLRATKQLYMLCMSGALFHAPATQVFHLQLYEKYSVHCENAVVNQHFAARPVLCQCSAAVQAASSLNWKAGVMSSVPQIRYDCAASNDGTMYLTHQYMS